MINARHYDEKRDHIRMRLETPIEIKLDTGNCIEAICLDLSVNGMQLELDQDIKTGESIEAHIRSNMGALPDLHSTATVVRNTRLDSDRYVVGVKIESMH